MKICYKVQHWGASYSPMGSRDHTANWAQQPEGPGYGSYPPPAPYWHHTSYPQLYSAYPYAAPSIPPQHAALHHSGHQQAQERYTEHLASTSTAPVMPQTSQILAAPTPTFEPAQQPAAAKRKRGHKENAGPTAKRTATGTGSLSSSDPLVPGVGPCTLHPTASSATESTLTASQRANIEFCSLLTTGDKSDDSGLASDVWFQALPAQTREAPANFIVGVGYNTDGEAPVQNPPPSRHRLTSPFVRCRLCT